MNSNPSNFISLESIQIATPCRADWDKMTGDDQARFCGSCAKNVYNFSTMTRDEAERLILEKEGHLCVRLHRRTDGTVITSDCAVGISPVKRSAGWVRTLMATVVAAIVGIFGMQSTRAQGASTAEMGEMVCEPVTGAPQVPAKQPAKRPVGVTMGIVALPKPTPKPKPTAKPTPKPVKMPSKAGKKANGNRATRKSAKPVVQHR